MTPARRIAGAAEREQRRRARRERPGRSVFASSCARCLPRRRRSGAGPSRSRVRRARRAARAAAARALSASAPEATIETRWPNGGYPSSRRRASSSARKPDDVVPGGIGERARVGLEGLDEHRARSVAAAPAGELGHELERALLRPEVREPEPGVRIHDRGERDAREVMALRDHLGSDEDDAIGGGEPLERLLERTALRSRVGVEPDPLELGHVLLELASPAAACRRRSAPARASRTRDSSGLGLGEAAVVAVQTAVAVQRERDVAAPAAAREAAGPAVQRGHEAAPVEEQDRLAAAARRSRRGRRGAAPRAGSRPRAGDRRSSRSASARRAAARARAARAAPSSPAAAWRCRRRRRRPRARPASPRPCARRSAGRTPACTRRRAPRR